MCVKGIIDVDGMAGRPSWRSIMDIRTILVHVDIDSHRPDFFRTVGSLAQRFDAKVLGHAAASPSAAYVGIDGGNATAEIYAQERDEIEKQLAGIEGEFRAAMPHGMAVEWQSLCAPPNMSLNDHLYRADLVVAQSVQGSWGDTVTRHLDLGDLILSAGRPVLVVGTPAAMKAESIVVGWKDSREARRAIADALPFLKTAAKVCVVSVDEDASPTSGICLDGLVGWLARHGVTAESQLETEQDDAVVALSDIAAREKADLIVTGGYGHNRLREWLFGGVTRGLLQNSALNRLMSN
jgi:nucleotide-binding universal stress UspA family protein